MKTGRCNQHIFNILVKKISSLLAGYNFSLLFSCLSTFFTINFFKKIFSRGPNCLQRLSADEKCCAQEQCDKITEKMLKVMPKLFNGFLVRPNKKICVVQVTS